MVAHGGPPLHLAHLSLINFRSFRQLDLDLPKGVAVLHGDNAQGKTNLLEAVYLLSIAKSFRAQNERELVNREAAQEQGQALASGLFMRKDGRLKVSVGFQWAAPEQSGEPLVRKQVRVNGVARTAADLVGLANAVLFSAQDVELVFGAPSQRRRFLDILISQVDPLYLRSLQRYQRVLFQRNQLLKTLRDGRASPEEMAFWDAELVKEGASIVLRRLEALDALTPLAQETHQQLTTGAEALRMEYACSVRTSQRDGVAVALAEALQAGKGREMAAGATLVGPHRDDLRLLIGGVEAGAYASRGQARTAGLALRLAEAAYLAACKGEAPVLLLDDVLSELDASRRRHVLERAAAHDQALITTTDLSPIGTPFLDHAAKLRVDGGAVYPGPSSQ